MIQPRCDESIKRVFSVTLIQDAPDFVLFPDEEIIFHILKAKERNVGSHFIMIYSKRIMMIQDTITCTNNIFCAF